MTLAYLALIGRILLTGYEKIIFKQVGQNSGSEETVFIIFTTGTFFLAPFIFFAELPTDYSFIALASLSSLVYTVQTVFYVKALSQGEASLVGPLYNFNVFFLLALTTIFLDESLSWMKIAGIILLVYGASFLNRKQNILLSLKALLKEKACRYMIFSSLLVAVGRTIDCYVVRGIHPIVYTLTLCILTCLFLFIYLFWRGKLKDAAALFKKRKCAGITAGAVDCYSYLLLIFAIRRIEVSVAEPATMLGMIVTVVLAYFIFREKIKERLMGVLIMIAGAWLLFI